MIAACRGCGSDRLTEVLDLGEQRLSDFRLDPGRPPRFPLKLLACGHCTLAQLSHTVPRGLMYHDRYGYASGVSEAIRADLANVVEQALLNHPDPRRWLDIACNDGTLLSYVPPYIRRIGVDPVDRLAAEARRHATAIIVDYFDPARFDPASFDIVTSVSVFYDLDDPGGFVAGVAKVLTPRGIWIIQQNYLPAMLDGAAFDNICHEHITYFTLTALEPLLAAHDLQVVEVSQSPINGGVFRTLVARRGTQTVDPSVDLMRRYERGLRLDDPATWQRFAQRARNTINRVSSLIREANANRQQVMIYAASTRGAVIWQAAGLDDQLITAAVERQPSKVGRYYSAIGVPIIDEATARQRHPDYMLVGPYWLREHITRRETQYLHDGGSLVFPLPRFEVVGAGSP